MKEMMHFELLWPLRRRGAQCVVWVKPSQLDPQSWGPGSPYKRYCVQHYYIHGGLRLERRVTGFDCEVLTEPEYSFATTVFHFDGLLFFLGGPR